MTKVPPPGRLMVRSMHTPWATKKDPICGHRGVDVEAGLGYCDWRLGEARQSRHSAARRRYCPLAVPGGLPFPPCLQAPRAQTAQLNTFPRPCLPACKWSSRAGWRQRWAAGAAPA